MGEGGLENETAAGRRDETDQGTGHPFRLCGLYPVQHTTRNQQKLCGHGEPPAAPEVIFELRTQEIFQLLAGPVEGGRGRLRG
jgi:hypothetical protein